ncbi:NAD(P)-dependent alcohol dehydrogenase [Anatilimnocola floriformis]|uniref:NAD(P)-dependent alcohol dehydrogenase n=1 Tax=Anatilimnocola floriformis TaxID=2948575 RepID=UPI0020C2EFF0|nr:NAD(P)-dependent alcohol dehydrogenase [Anatilimnocola floriformis]
MSEKMKCFAMHGIGKVGMLEKPIPRAGPNDAIIRTTVALICTSDVHTVAGAIGDRHGLTLGHEAVGVIHELGELAAASGLFKIGQRVAVNAITPCYACDNCQRGYSSQCGEMLGGWKFANLKDGSFAEFFHVNNAMTNLAPIPAGLSDEQAAYCCDMLSTGFVGAEHANIPIGGSVAIFSQGPVGLMATVGARLRGAGLIIGVESMPNRVALARKYGCDVVVDFTQDDPVEAILKLTGGKGVDSSIEALGAAQTFSACVRVTRPGGTISNIGYHGDGDNVPIPRVDWGVGMSDKTIRTGLCPGGAERMGRLLRLIENGRVDPLPLTTHRFPFHDIEKAFRMMQTKEDGMIKPLISFP